MSDQPPSDQPPSEAKRNAPPTKSAAPPVRAPLIIFGTMFLMSIVSVAIVFVVHSRRDQPYLQSKKRRVRYVQLAKSKTLSLNYRAFGPQSIAFEVIGNQWWQWQSGPGDAAPTDFDIKVIVYREVSVEELTERFPLIEAKRMDARYLKFVDAIDYLNAQIAVGTQPELNARLEATREKLLNHFAPSGAQP